MLQKKKRVLFYAVFLALLMVPVTAAADDEIQFEKVFTSFTPLFMDGHEGDMEWIEGFTGAGDIYLGTTKMGTVTFTATFINPPMSYTDRYEYVKMKMVNTLTDMGTFEVNGIVLALGSSTYATDYNATLSWTGSISNGTGSLSSLVGLSAGTIQANMGTLTAAGKELLLYRLSY
ncbi:MAG: hypothetical protein ACQEQ7_06835 [Thermodesulfobacteriota bacterium]